jgi:hypothetical protein
MTMHPNSRQLEQIHMSRSNHRRQTLWQIWAPLGLFLVLILVLGVMAAVTTAQNSVMGTHFADISAVFLIIPAAFFGLVFLALFAGLIFALSKLLSALPIWSLQARAFFYNIEATVLMIMDQIVRPFFAIESAWSGIENFFAHFRKNKA